MSLQSKLFSIQLSSASASPRFWRQPWPAVRFNPIDLLTGAALLGLFVTWLALIQFSTPNLVDNDGYYHIKLAQLMREGGLKPAFPWLPLSVLNPHDFVDHHWLYHVLLIPFTYGDLVNGAKWASVIFPAVTFLAGWLLLHGQRIPYAAWWAIGFLAVSEAFLYRMSMPRAQAASLLVLLLALHVTLRQRYGWLLPLAFLYVWFYNAFPLILLVVGVYVAMRWLLERQLNLAPLVYTGLGLALGLVINPYFPNNLIFIYHHLFPKLTETTAISVGNEWYPYQTWTLVENSGPALLAYVAGAFALGLSGRRMTVRTATLLVLATLFGLMLFKSRRFVEYYPAFALLFCALAWTSLVEDWLKSKNWLRFALPVGLTLALIPALWWNLPAAQESMQSAKPTQRYAAASAWLEKHTPAGSRIFQTDWDDFPRLFFYNTHNTYLIGLDPTYMQLYDADLYNLWVKTTRGKVKNPATTIAQTFGSHYIITDLEHKAFLRQAKADPQLVEVYRDEFAVILQVADTTK
ncbi:MAG: hypothetical protein U0401_32410 [Anaerolineae bacterium]